MKMKRSFIAVVLVLCFLVPAASALAADAATEAMAGFGMLAAALASPELAYPVALNKNVWNDLVDNLMPSVSLIKEPLRLIALHATPILKPTATLPDHAAVGNKYISNGYSQIISFGDSMSDNGNMFQVGMDIANCGVPMEPNFEGRFSDGPVVLEIMSDLLNRSLLNYAFGGAKSGNDSLIPAYGFSIGMLSEVDDFISNLGWKSADSRALYVIWTGPDDFYKGVSMFDSTVVFIVTNNIKTGMAKLYKKGARNFFIPLMPDLSITPSARLHENYTAGYMKAANKRSVELSNSLTAMLKSFAKQYPLAKVRTFDTFTVLTAEKQKYADRGYNVTDGCYEPPFMGLPGPVCDNPAEYLFWDGNHPTAWVSKIIGEHFAYAAVGTPLPSR
jgi:cholinesterase